MKRTLPLLALFFGIVQVTGLAASLEGVGLTVGVDPQTNLFKEVETNDPMIKYSAKTANEIIISPKLLYYHPITSENPRDLRDYLEVLAKGGPIEPMSPGGEFNLSFPGLDVKLVNNSSRPLHFSESIVDVASSHLDATPLPILLSDYDQLLYFELHEEGWSPIESCRINFSVSPKEWTREPETYRFEKQFGAFDKSIIVDVSDEIRQSGAPAAYIAKAVEYQKLQAALAVEERKLSDAGVENPTEDKGYKAMENQGPSDVDLLKLEKKLGGPFSRKGEAYLAGTIYYSWRAPDGQVKEAKTRFRTAVLTRPPEGLGAAGPVSGEYETMLKKDGENYQLRVPISQSVQPGGVSRFIVKLGAPCSSLHKLTLKLVTTAGDTVESKPIALNVLLPRSAVDALRENDQPNK